MRFEVFVNGDIFERMTASAVVLNTDDHTVYKGPVLLNGEDEVNALQEELEQADPGRSYYHPLRTARELMRRHPEKYPDVRMDIIGRQFALLEDDAHFYLWVAMSYIDAVQRNTFGLSADGAAALSDRLMDVIGALTAAEMAAAKITSILRSEAGRDTLTGRTASALADRLEAEYKDRVDEVFLKGVATAVANLTALRSNSLEFIRKGAGAMREAAAELSFNKEYNHDE